MTAHQHCQQFVQICEERRRDKQKKNTIKAKKENIQNDSAHAHTQIHEIVDDGVEDIAGRLIGRLAEHAEQVSVFIR